MNVIWGFGLISVNWHWNGTQLITMAFNFKNIVWVFNISFLLCLLILFCCYFTVWCGEKKLVFCLLSIYIIIKSIQYLTILFLRPSETLACLVNFNCEGKNFAMGFSGLKTMVMFCHSLSLTDLLKTQVFPNKYLILLILVITRHFTFLWDLYLYLLPHKPTENCFKFR